jgi:hypothetical protein
VIPEYIRAALEHARYGIIEDAKPYYGEVPGLPRVFAAGRTLEECRRNLAGVIGERFIIRLRAAPWIGVPEAYDQTHIEPPREEPSDSGF